MIQRLLCGIGVACLACYVLVSARAAFYQFAAQWHLDRVASIARLPDDQGRPPVGPSKLLGTEILGRLDIPRLHLSAAVAEGEDEHTLSVAVGHLPDTPLPWEHGNAALAGHRDTFFRPLEDIRLGDVIRLATPHGEFRYRVSRTWIVRLDAVWVLAPTQAPSLTLVTCYPFSYIGSAPQRFIVRAEPIESSPADRQPSGARDREAGRLMASTPSKPPVVVGTLKDLNGPNPKHRPGY